MLAVHTHNHTHTHTITHTQSHTHTHNHTHTQSHTHTITHIHIIHTHTIIHTHNHTYTIIHTPEGLVRASTHVLHNGMILFLYINAYLHDYTYNITCTHTVYMNDTARQMHTHVCTCVSVAHLVEFVLLGLCDVCVCLLCGPAGEGNVVLHCLVSLGDEPQTSSHSLHLLTQLHG